MLTIALMLSAPLRVQNLAVTNGRPIDNHEDSESVGKRGPLLLQVRARQRARQY
jgi:catalase